MMRTGLSQFMRTGLDSFQVSVRLIQEFLYQSKTESSLTFLDVRQTPVLCW